MKSLLAGLRQGFQQTETYKEKVIQKEKEFYLEYIVKLMEFQIKDGAACILLPNYKSAWELDHDLFQKREVGGIKWTALDHVTSHDRHQFINGTSYDKVDQVVYVVPLGLTSKETSQLLKTVCRCTCACNVEFRPYQEMSPF